MGCAQGAAEHHGERTGQRGADDAAGQDAQRVSGSIRDRALGDKAEAHNVVHDAVAALVGAPLFGAKGRRQGNRNRGHHAADHDRGHNPVVAGGQRRRAKDVGRLVEGAAHINAHHAGNDCAQQDLGRAAHGVQPVGHCRVDDAHNRVDAAHDRTNNEDAAQRIDQHRADAVEAGRQLLGDLLEELHDVARGKARQQRRQEAAGDAGGLTVGKGGKVRTVHGQHAARKADGQTRTVRNRHGDKACKDRQHITERRIADGLEERRHRRVHAEVGRVNRVIVQQEGQRDHDAAAHDEGQHVRYTVHQVLVQAVAKAVACAARGLPGLGPGLGVVDGSFTVGNFLDQLLRLVDAIVHAGKQHRFAVEAGGLDVLVRRNDDAVTGGDLLGGQHILGSVGAVRLDLGWQTELVAHLGQGLSGHVGMGNAVGAGRDGQHTVAVLGDLLLGEALLAKLGILLGVDGVEKFGGRLGGAQLFDEVVVHQHLHHTGQHVNVQAAILRRGNRKQQVGFAVVIGVVLDRGAQPQRRQAGAGHAGCAGVGHRDAVVHVGGCLGLAGVESLFVGVLIGDIAVGRLQINELVKDGGLIRGSDIQRDGLRGEQFRDTHRTVLLLLFK